MTLLKCALLQLLYHGLIQMSNFPLFIHAFMHLSMFSPRVGAAGIPWGLDQQKTTSPGNSTEHFQCCRTALVCSDWSENSELDELKFGGKRKIRRYASLYSRFISLLQHPLMTNVYFAFKQTLQDLFLTKHQIHAFTFHLIILH